MDRKNSMPLRALFLSFKNNQVTLRFKMLPRVSFQPTNYSGTPHFTPVSHLGLPVFFLPL